jgi:tRNA-Thr(GGU) m(6)t(6)A37 methyltransferase TsaA
MRPDARDFDGDAGGPGEGRSRRLEWPPMPQDHAPITLEPIGSVAGAGDDVGRVDWAGVRSEIRLREGLGEALLGLADYSHVIVIGWLDRIPDELRARRRAYPAGDERYPLQGALALRGGARPNPLSVTVCRLLAVDGDTLRVEGLDLVDGTPVLDVKPYIAHYDAVPKATLPKWARG